MFSYLRDFEVSSVSFQAARQTEMPGPRGIQLGALLSRRGYNYDSIRLNDKFGDISRSIDMTNRQSI
jgi:hypothetical protein